MVVIDGIEIKWVICITTNHAHLMSIPSNSSARTESSVLSGNTNRNFSMTSEFNKLYGKMCIFSCLAFNRSRKAVLFHFAAIFLGALIFPIESGEKIAWAKISCSE